MDNARWAKYIYKTAKDKNNYIKSNEPLLEISFQASFVFIPTLIFVSWNNAFCSLYETRLDYVALTRKIKH